ncbi:MAG: hypothetical protein COU30_02015 [Candidatus Magasanikbacteria bacterium CG10_big_fil_rev_8_21_14_0_10_38_6]|uniref:Uncharacterized protein n=1 Tax=Candidatus Magasanikbacteria bacterium CG10_big_fil_rev_8_21_14_0_10_38_6 TaxID=1974647 RepID=A0A2M6P1A0_9BACT|nr:MAG: hypothetical protein COU30_02015 [Candidatus Magasanikbacteria bacterium CG10_big_fil_rev_8_21_14_0_10_38_6]
MLLVQKIKKLTAAKTKINTKRMQKHTWSSDTTKSEYSLVYYYLLAGIALVVAVFLFLPRVSMS